jgi:hypothetical protein
MAMLRVSVKTISAPPDGVSSECWFLKITRGQSSFASLPTRPSISRPTGKPPRVMPANSEKAGNAGIAAGL